MLYMYIAGQYETVHGYSRCKLTSPLHYGKGDIVLVTTNAIMTFCFSGTAATSDRRVGKWPRCVH